MKLRYYKRSTVISVSRIIPRAKLSGALLMRPKLQKHSALKLAGRIIPHKRDIIPRSLLRNVSKLALGLFISVILGIVKLLINYCDFFPEKQVVRFPQNTNAFALDMVSLQW